MKFLKIVGQGEGRKVVCLCGHREKYDTFEKRMAAQKNSMSKRDVENFMQSQNKKADKKEDNAFSALKGLKF